jgi:hypothetical protein
MDVRNKIPQLSFGTLEEFIGGNNNFWHYFNLESFLGEAYRKNSVFQRFYKQNQAFADALLEKTTLMYRKNYSVPSSIIPWERTLPWDELYMAYVLMSELVDESDPYSRRENGNLNNRYLLG